LSTIAPDFNRTKAPAQQKLDFDPDSLRGRITPSLAAAAEEALINFRDGGMATYTGSDVRVIIELASPGAGAPRFSKQLLEVTTLTVSCHRVKTPAVACG
jgi:hypothetical protein